MEEAIPFAWLLLAFGVCYGAYRLWMYFGFRCSACNGHMARERASGLRNLGEYFRVSFDHSPHHVTETWRCRQCGERQTFDMDLAERRTPSGRQHRWYTQVTGENE